MTFLSTYTVVCGLREIIVCLEGAYKLKMPAHMILIAYDERVNRISKNESDENTQPTVLSRSFMWDERRRDGQERKDDKPNIKVSDCYEKDVSN